MGASYQQHAALLPFHLQHRCRCSHHTIFIYRTRATISPSQLMAIPLKIKLKSSFHAFFMCKFQSPKIFFWLINVACSGASTVRACILHICNFQAALCRFLTWKWMIISSIMIWFVTYCPTMSLTVSYFSPSDYYQNIKVSSSKAHMVPGIAKDVHGKLAMKINRIIKQMA